MGGVLLIELKGFEQITSSLSRDMEELSITPERARAIVIEVAEQYIRAAGEAAKPVRVDRPGGDTWAFEFLDIEAAVTFGVRFLQLAARGSLERGYMFLKPSLTANSGAPRSHDGRIIDQATINAYRAADGGVPYEFVILNHDHVKSLAGFPVETREARAKGNKQLPRAQVIKWNSPHGGTTEADIHLRLASIMLDGEVVYSDTAAEALHLLLRLQRESREIHVFGGPITFADMAQNSYLRETIALMLTGAARRWVIVSYIPRDQPEDSYAWLELCRRLQKEFPKNLEVSAFLIEGDAVRPFSYQIFDKKLVHVGLRKYSMERGTPTMSGAILIRNELVARRFYEDFEESHRGIPRLSEAKHEELTRLLDGVNPSMRQEVIEAVSRLIEDVRASTKITPAA